MQKGFRAKLNRKVVNSLLPWMQKDGPRKPKRPIATTLPPGSNLSATTTRFGDYRLAYISRERS